MPIITSGSEDVTLCKVKWNNYEIIKQVATAVFIQGSHDIIMTQKIFSIHQYYRYLKRRLLLSRVCLDDLVVFVAIQSGRILASIQIDTHDLGVLQKEFNNGRWLSRFVIHPQCKNYDIATALVNHAIKYSFHKYKIEHLYVWTSEIEKETWYKQFGFQTIHEFSRYAYKDGASIGPIIVLVRYTAFSQ